MIIKICILAFKRGNKGDKLGAAYRIFWWCISLRKSEKSLLKEHYDLL